MNAELKDNFINYLLADEMYKKAFDSYFLSLDKKETWKVLEKKRLLFEYERKIEKEKIKKLFEWEQRAKRMFFDQEEHTLFLIRKIADKITDREHKDLERLILTNQTFETAVKKKNITINDEDEIISARFVYIIYLAKTGRAVSFKKTKDNKRSNIKS